MYFYTEIILSRREERRILLSKNRSLINILSLSSSYFLSSAQNISQLQPVFQPHKHLSNLTSASKLLAKVTRKGLISQLQCIDLFLFCYWRKRYRSCLDTFICSGNPFFKEDGSGLHGAGPGAADLESLAMSSLHRAEAFTFFCWTAQHHGRILIRVLFRQS